MNLFIKYTHNFVKSIKSSWDVLLHHLETVAGSLPSGSANHFPICLVSDNTAVIQLSFIVYSLVVIIPLIGYKRKFRHFCTNQQIFVYAFKHKRYLNKTFPIANQDLLSELSIGELREKTIHIN